MTRTRRLALATVLPLGLAAVLAPVPAQADPALSPAAPGPFGRLATYPVFQNVLAGVDPADETVAEISAVSRDGRTVVYTDAAGKRIGFVDISDPAAPVGRGTLDLAELGDADDQPTSVAVVGDYVLVVVDTSGGDFTNPSGRLDVVRLADRERVRSIDLGGQPDSIAIAPSGDYAAIAMENQRDEEAPPSDDPDGEEGDLPQTPPGFVVTLDLVDPAAPASWTPHDVPLPAEQLAGLYAPTDPEPEYVDIDADDQLVVTLQENNGVVVLDLPTRDITSVFSAGNAVVPGVDTEDDGLFDFTSTIDLPREPDSVQWVGDGLVATANEGDLRGGTRGWTVFDAATGAVVWDAGNTFEYTAVADGLWAEGRADNKGTEPEGLAFDEIGGVPYAFVGSERSNFVAVYDMTDPRSPAFVQALPTTNGPEGLLPIPARDLLVVSSETDDAEAGVRATVGVYRVGSGARFPSLRSVPAAGSAPGSAPIGWGALSGLSGAPGDPDRLWAVSDSAYATGRIYGIDRTTTPATIDAVTTVTEADGSAPALDLEGVAARPGGGFWLVSEGATGPANQVLRTDAAGVVQQTVSLPDDVAAGLGRMGLEGVAVTGSGTDEQVYVALQRPLAGEDGARVGRHDVAAGTWTWWTVPLSESANGGTVGLSEITVTDDGTVAVVERDDLNGPAAEIKRVHTLDLPTPTGEVTPATKTLAVDLLPTLRAQNGWTQEKLEGLATTADGEVYAVTDNDGLDDATGETQLLDVGPVDEVLPGTTAEPRRTTTVLKADRTQVRRGATITLTVRVTGVDDGDRVAILRNGKQVRTLSVSDGRATLDQRMYAAGTTRFAARTLADDDSAASRSGVVRVRVRQR